MLTPEQRRQLNELKTLESREEQERQRQQEEEQERQRQQEQFAVRDNIKDRILAQLGVRTGYELRIFDQFGIEQRETFKSPNLQELKYLGDDKIHSRDAVYTKINEIQLITVNGNTYQIEIKLEPIKKLK